VTKRVPTTELSPKGKPHQDMFVALAAQHQAWIKACCRSMGISERDLEDVTSPAPFYFLVFNVFQSPLGP